MKAIDTVAAVLLLVAVTQTPSAAALPGIPLGPGSIMVCDVAVMPTKCAAAAAKEVTACAEATLDGPFGYQTSGSFCATIIGAAAASVAVHIPQAAHHDFVRVGTSTGGCYSVFTNLLGLSACGDAVAGQGCGTDASASGGVTNFGPITTGDVTASTQPCPIPPPPDPQDLPPCYPDPPLEMCPGLAPILCLPSSNWAVPPELDIEVPGPTVCAVDGNSAQDFGQLEDLPEHVQAALKAALEDEWERQLIAEMGAWPSGDLPDRLGTVLLSASARAAQSLDPSTQIWYVFG